MSLPKVADHHTVFVLALMSGLMAFVLSSVAGENLLSKQPAEPVEPLPMPIEPAAIAPSAIVLTERPVVRNDAGIVKFFFASGQTSIPKNADKELDAVVQAIKYGKRAQITGFHDAIGDAKANAELAAQRAQVVKQALLTMGIQEAQIEIRPTIITAASVSNDQARRVEVNLVD